MNRSQTLAVALLVAVLPITSPAFASDRNDNHRPRHHSGHHYRNYDNGHQARPIARHYCGDHDRYHYGAGHSDAYYDHQEHNRASIVLPIPFPPFPHIEIHH